MAISSYQNAEEIAGKWRNEIWRGSEIKKF